MMQHNRRAAALVAGVLFAALQGTAFAATTTPTISSISPVSAKAGAKVTIVGKNLTGATSVMFDGVTAKFTVSSATKISATVPAKAKSGVLEVRTAGGMAKSSKSFSFKA